MVDCVGSSQVRAIQLELHARHGEVVRRISRNSDGSGDVSRRRRGQADRRRRRVERRRRIVDGD